MHRLCVYLLLWLQLTSCKEQPINPEVFLIPEGYVGTVYVVYNVEPGEAEIYEKNSARLFNISSDGVLHTQFNDNNHGLVTKDVRHFFYVDRNGKRTDTLKLLSGRIDNTQENRLDPAIYAHFSGYGTQTFNNETDSLGCRYALRIFYIGTLQQKLNSEGTFSISDYYIENGYPCKDKLYFLDKPPVTITP